MSDLDADTILAEIADALEALAAAAERLACAAEAREAREAEAAARWAVPALGDVTVADLAVEMPALDLGMPALDLEGDADGVDLLDADGERVPLPPGVASIRLRGARVGVAADERT